MTSYIRTDEQKALVRMWDKLSAREEKLEFEEKYFLNPLHSSVYFFFF